MLQGQAICKDCGNGTLNNELNTQFDFDGIGAAICLRCGSSHIDGELYFEEENARLTANDEERSIIDERE